MPTKKQYGSEYDDSEDDIHAFVKKKESKEPTQPMSKRQMKKDKLLQSSLATMYDQGALKQKIKMNAKMNQ